MDTSRKVEDEQRALWNGTAGHAWVEAQEVIDGMYRQLAELLAEAATPGDRVLDVGCGAGGTTLAVAERVGPDGRCTGVDISAPLIAAARRRGIPADFLVDDAQTAAFPPAAFDLVISRFGVMFFADPVAAFANLRGATRDGGGLRVITWRDPAENPFMTTMDAAARAVLPDLPERDPDGPGAFTLADRDHVADILTRAGWTQAALRPVDAACAFPEPELVPFLTRLGPLGQILPELEPAARERIIESVREAFEPFVDAGMVRFTAACWVVEARA